MLEFVERSSQYMESKLINNSYRIFTKRRKFLNLSACLILGINIFALDEAAAWSPTEPPVSVAAFDADYGSGIEVDLAGNIYTLGSFNGTVDFDPSVNSFFIPSFSGRGLFVSKMNKEGDFLWARYIGATNESGITLDPLGNVYIWGEFSGEVDFDPGVGETKLVADVRGLNDFIVKLDSSGNFVWAKTVGTGFNWNGLSSVLVDSQGQIYAAGSFRNRAYLDPSGSLANSFVSAGYDDIFVLKLDVSGNFVWAKTVGGSFIDKASDLDIDSFGNVYITGEFSDTVDFDPGPGTTSAATIGGIFFNTDVFVLKLDVSGNFVWVKIVGGTLGKTAIDIEIDALDNIFVIGAFEGSVDFDPGIETSILTSRTQGNGFYPFSPTQSYILKLDQGGNYSWVKSFGDSVRFNGLRVDQSGNVHTAGCYYESVSNDGLIIRPDFDPGPLTYVLPYGSSCNAFISKLNNAGEFIWAKGFVSYSWISASKPAVDMDGNVLITGQFEGKVDFDPGEGTAELSNRNMEAYILKLDILGRILSIPKKTAGSSFV